MEEILSATRDERARLFQTATDRSENIRNRVIIEKDFWVCWALNRIFSNTTIAPHIIFKGGTSLSKCYSIIARFSEDIDLTLSKSYIGITEENDPILASTTSQRGKRLNDLTDAVITKINNDVKPLLFNEFQKSLSQYFNENEWQLTTAENDEQTLIFHYPSCFEKISTGYIQTAIRLELGARGDNNPCETKTISPYIQQILPELFETSSGIPVTALTAKRTYWEKVTLLHAEYHRDATKHIPSRLFRHYYDIVMMDHRNITRDALQDTTLLNDVVRNKINYFPSKWASYETANIGNLRLYPNEIFLELLRDDSQQMGEMFFGDRPDFEYIMSEIKRIEEVINRV